MPSHRCKHPTCDAILAQSGYCLLHLPAAQSTHADYDRYKRDPWSKRFYSSAAWLKARARQLSRFPLCQETGCRQLATIVHHRRPVKEVRFREPRLLLAEENFESVCQACHNRLEKTN